MHSELLRPRGKLTSRQKFWPQSCNWLRPQQFGLGSTAFGLIKHTVLENIVLDTNKLVDHQHKLITTIL